MSNGHEADRGAGAVAMRRDDGINDRAGSVGGNAVAPLKRTAIAGLVPQTLDDVYRLATAIAKSGLAPAQMKTPEAITVAILTGLEIGLPPMFALNKIAVINGRPTLWGDAIPGILWARGFKLREWVEGEIAHCEVTRPDGTMIRREFSTDDAKAAGLWGKQGPWKQYPERMLQMRARAFAARDGAADVLGGLYVSEEVADGGRLVDAVSEPFKRKSSSAAKKDGTDKKLNEIRGEIASAVNVEMLNHIRNSVYADDWEVMPARWVEILDHEFEDKMASFEAVA